MTTLSVLRIDAGDVVLRKARDDDRRSIIEHLVDPDVHAHLGGPQPRLTVTAISTKPASRRRRTRRAHT